MDKIIGVTELQRNFRNVLDDVVDQKASYILTRGSRPEAVLISYEQYRQFVAGNSNDVLARIERLLAKMARENEQYSDEQVAADLSEATREHRAHKRA
jgi:prevent-host-death family protein